MRVRWLCGGRVFDGVSRQAGAEYDLEDGTARSLIEQGFAEALPDPIPAMPRAAEPRPFDAASIPGRRRTVSEEET